MLAGSSLKYENQLWTAVRRPIRPAATRSRTATHDGWRRYMKASMRRHARRASQTSTIRWASSAVMRQRLLAQDVLAGPGGGDRPLGVEVVRERDVHGIDVGVGQERLVGAMGRRDGRAAPPRRVPARRPATRSPRRRSGPRVRIPGITFWTAMSAVERIPQRTCARTSPPPPTSRIDMTASMHESRTAHLEERNTNLVFIDRDELGQRSETVRRANLERDRPRAARRAGHRRAPSSSPGPG